MSYDVLLQNIIDTQQKQGTLIGEMHGTLQSLQSQLLDNGQPGRITKVERRVTDLEEHKHKTTGWVAGASAVTSLFISFFVWLLVKTHLIAFK